MSVCTQPIVAANRQVAAPMKVTNPIAVGLASNIGDRRHTMNTPAVTIVAAWISAETGVGPSIASGSQVWRPNCADLQIGSASCRARLGQYVLVSVVAGNLKQKK